MLEQSAKIFVAGHRGLVGSAIWNNLKQRGYTNLTGRTHQELDLLDPMAVKPADIPIICLQMITLRI